MADDFNLSIELAKRQEAHLRLLNEEVGNVFGFLFDVLAEKGVINRTALMGLLEERIKAITPPHEGHYDIAHQLWTRISVTLEFFEKRRYGPPGKTG